MKVIIQGIKILIENILGQSWQFRTCILSTKNGVFNRNSTLSPKINIFGTNRNLRLSPPKSDTCETWKIQNCGPGDSNENLFYENDLKLHREEANEGYKTITKMSKIVKEDPHKLVIAVDLQQALPTPKFTSFTKRSLCNFRQLFWAE